MCGFRPSISTIYRTLIFRLGYSRKVRTVRNKKTCPIQQAEHLRVIAPIPWTTLVSVDATHCNGPSKTQRRYGRSLRGEPCHREDWILNDRRFTAYAAMTPKGFKSWVTEEENCNALTFQRFMTDSYGPLKESDEFVIFDNASIQVEEGSLAVVDNVTDGLWKRIPPYNPRLAPIERGFAMVWQEVRRNEKEALADPIGTIHKAFEKYSVIGPEGYKSKSSILYIN
jgi:hypothetical protein